jgi:hypothetical protein
LDSFDTWDIRKNCPAEKLEAYLKISGVLSFWSLSRLRRPGTN